MKIRLREKYKPYSHEEGISLLLPRSSWKATVYPAKVLLKNLMTIGETEELTLIPHLQGPLTQFTVMQDLERKWIRVFGRGEGGFFSYRLFAASSEIVLFLERSPKEGMTFSFEGETRRLQRKEELILPTIAPSFPLLSQEKIHLGCHKKQDWTLVRRRLLLEEILPIWFQLGKDIPSHPMLRQGTGELLSQCADFVNERNRVKIGPALVKLFKGGFEGILAPHLHDVHFQGIEAPEEISSKASPLMLLGEGARLIRSLFINVVDGEIALLPCLPTELHAGKIISAPLTVSLSCDFEWSKKLLRRLYLYSSIDQEITLKLQSPIKSFRYRTTPRGKGIRIDASSPLQLKKGLNVLD
ncbi:MAG: hypothetical protein KDK60_00950, partial [Chlamydiia bacterium]|nr:hypothetical protein [Chlamydiia bacterium]